MAVRLVFYAEGDGSCPILEFLDSIPDKAVDKCYVKLERLKEQGHNLRRPEADFLRDGIYELRIGLNGINYRLLYFFSGRELIVLSHGLIKERAVPSREIDGALKRKDKYMQDPIKHTYKD